MPPALSRIFDTLLRVDCMCAAVECTYHTTLPLPCCLQQDQVLTVQCRTKYYLQYRMSSPSDDDKKGKKHWSRRKQTKTRRRPIPRQDQRRAKSPTNSDEIGKFTNTTAPLEPLYGVAKNSRSKFGPYLKGCRTTGRRAKK